MKPAQQLLPDVPPELLAIILSKLGTLDLACLAGTCRLLWCGAPTHPPPLPTPGLVETELRRRAEARGLHIGSSLPDGALSWVPYLLKRDFYDMQRRQAPLAVGEQTGMSRRSIFVNKAGGLHLACRRAEIQAGKVGEPLVGYDWGSAAGTSGSVPPTLVPSMQGTRIVSVATGGNHCLALSAEGEVYSWGDGAAGALGHADWDAEAGPRKIATLSRVESITVGKIKSAAVDDRGRLFTWGRAVYGGGPSGLGYEHDPETACQLTPKRVEALSEDRVVGVAFSDGFTLAVTDAGAVFSFGYSPYGTLCHGSSASEVLPRRIEALAETGQRFVAATAGVYNALALTEENHVYEWSDGPVNGRGTEQPTPRLTTALAGEHVRFVYTHGFSSCAVTEKGELYTWSQGQQQTPKRVEALRHVKIAAVAICGTHTLVAGADGVAWAFGEHAALGLGDIDAPRGIIVGQPTPIPNLRLRV